jgi:hypothetical protein
VWYAATDTGLELPVVDVTHPAFEFACDDDELARIAARTRQGLERVRKLPAFALRLLTRRSVIAGDMQRTRGGPVSGMTTYLFKLGPENLPISFGSRFDRMMLAEFGPSACRLRLRETATRIADAAAPVLAQRPGPLMLLNLAGGVAADSFNACILLRARYRGLLERRRVEIFVLDIDKEGPAFGARAVAALRHPGAPLCGVDVRVSHSEWDWAHAPALGRALSTLDDQGVLAISSEGGVFEYAPDDVVRSVLCTLGRHTPEGTPIIGSLVRDDDFQWLTNGDGAPGVRPRGLESFSSLVATAGWPVASASTLGPYHVVTLRNAGCTRP